MKLCSLPSSTVSLKPDAFLQDNLYRNGPVSRRFSSFLQRLKSFDDSPFKDRTSGLTAKVLSRAGLYYFGQIDSFRDAVRCFYCGIGLFDFKKDDTDALEMHAKFTPDCPYVVETIERDTTPEETGEIVRRWQRKSSSVYLSTLVSSETVGDVLEKQWIDHRRFFDSFHSFVTAISVKNNAKIRAVSTPGTMIDTCKVCWVTQICILFAPCTHLVCCHECSVKVSECPYCRCRIKARIIARFT